MGKSEYNEIFTNSDSSSESTSRKHSRKNSKKNSKKHSKEIKKILEPFNLVCIKGERGERGPRGDTGPHGLCGKKGSRGSRGKTGREGPRGPRGHTGIPGKSGHAFKWRGEWIEGEKYEPYEVVYYNGSCYISITCNTSKPDDNNIDWNLMVAGVPPTPTPTPSAPIRPGMRR
jgi:hypothetical protein